MNLQNKKAFTLVELIVVITILAILWTIAFISLQWFSRDARNSSRISDIKSIEKMFSFYELRESSYPEPSNYENITFSWVLMWKQWTYGESTRKIIWSQWNISNVPVDPLTWNEYTYSVSNAFDEYEVAAVLEWDLPDELSLYSNTYANWELWSTFIRWNYNKRFLEVTVWVEDYVLAIPSIIKWITISTDVEEILEQKKLLYHGSNSLPSSYSWTTLFNDDQIVWVVVNTGSLIAFSWSLDDLRNVSNDDIRKDFLENLQESYSGSLASELEWTKEILSVDTDVFDRTEYLSSTLVNHYLWGSLSVSEPAPLPDENNPPEWPLNCVFDWVTIFPCIL